VGFWPWIGFSFLAFPIGMDTSATENPPLPSFIACDDGCTFDPSTTVTPDLRYELTAIPEPATVWLVIACIGGSILLYRRRAG
jgi:hypothetical protein